MRGITPIADHHTTGAPVTGPEHHREAERLVALAREESEKATAGLIDSEGVAYVHD